MTGPRERVQKEPKGKDEKALGQSRPVKPVNQINPRVLRPLSSRVSRVSKPNQSQSNKKLVDSESKLDTSNHENADHGVKAKHVPTQLPHACPQTDARVPKSKSAYPAKFSKALSKYSAHLRDTIADKFEAAQQNVGTSVTKTQRTTEAQLEKLSKLHEPLELPLGEELLESMRHGGKKPDTKTTVSLDERMARFKRVFETESNRLVQLQKQLRETNEQLKALGQSVCCNFDDSNDSLPSQHPETEYCSAVSQLKKAYNRRKQDCLVQFEADTEDLLKRLTVAEDDHERDSEDTKQKLQELVQDSMDQ